MSLGARGNSRKSQGERRGVGGRCSLYQADATWGGGGGQEH